MLSAAVFDNRMKQLSGLGARGAFAADLGPAMHRKAWEEHLQLGTSSISKALKAKEVAKRLENGEVFAMAKAKGIIGKRWLGALSWQTPRTDFVRHWNPNFCNGGAGKFAIPNWFGSRLMWGFGMVAQVMEYVGKGFRTFSDGSTKVLDEGHKAACMRLCVNLPLNLYSSYLKAVSVAQPYVELF
jgi:hypothetical protein